MSSAVKKWQQKHKKTIPLAEATSTFRMQYEIQTKNEIISIIQQSSTGISHGELSNRIGIDRKNLRRYTTRLIKDQMISRQEGKRGKYYLGKKSIGDSKFASVLLSQLVEEKVLSGGDYIIVNKFHHNPRLKKYRDFRDYLPYFLKREEVGLERGIFEFSTKIGAIITYLVIQSMSPRMLYGQNFSNLGDLYDAEIQNWLKNIAVRLIPNLPYWLKKHIDEYVEFSDNSEH